MGGARSSYAKLRHRAYLVLEGGPAHGKLGEAIEIFIVVLIIANVVAFTLQSVPSIREPYWFDLEAFEVFSVAVFTLEYIARLWVAIENPLIRSHGRWKGRLRAALTPTMVIDFFAVAPVYFTVFFPYLDLRFLRMVRLFRLLKIARYSPALSTLGRVLAAERRALYGTFLLLICATVFAAAVMHAVEGSVQPDKFGTIPSAMWWAITTLTTVGYGDEVPITFWGRVVAGFTMVMGLGVLALPVGIVANGFMTSIHQREFVVTFGMLARVPLFKDFDAKLLSEVMSVLRSQSVAKGTIIAVKGAPAHAMYFIISGEVEAEVARRPVRFGPGDFFGELALLHQTHRRATIVALTNCRLLALSAEDFTMLTRKHPPLRGHIERAAEAHLVRYEREGDIPAAEISAATERRFEIQEDV
ncbi:voltage-gated potassium channel [Rhizomicrobium palustre]|uniref:Voltage-gated potassium channel n=1 Tax=Rhizomicrobium palustre TaxID=189966 RepID=A0A846MZD3_9PROT|nr:cyclic nucleotide-gated ion channel [Rhizomicrobium palustre]NIK88297.1 voltage-gated potassium channel [Rhizomicrobium palustre]